MKIRDRIKSFRRVAGRDLIPNPRNWRTHPPEQIDALKGILAEVGIAGALLARETKRGVELLDGHARGALDPDVKWPVLILDVTDEEADKSLTDTLIDPMPTGGPAIEQDNVPDQPKNAVSKAGQLWCLGPHRLLIGDATQRPDMARLMEKATASLLLTDPPYNVAYVGKTADALEIENDQMEEPAYEAFIHKALETALPYLKAGGVFYLWHADSHALPFRRAVRAAGLQTRQVLVWVKNCMVLCRQDYQWRHEPCCCGQKDLEGKARDKTHEPCLTGWKDGEAHRWLNDRCQTTVLEYDKPSKSEQHPTMKPLPLWGYLVGNSCPKGEIILDPFLGSGTTIAAAEGTGRIGYGLEIDPVYADVIIDRWQQLTGGKAVRAGQAHNSRAPKAKSPQNGRKPTKASAAKARR